MDHEGYRISERGISPTGNSCQNYDQFHQIIWNLCPADPFNVGQAAKEHGIDPDQIGKTLSLFLLLTKEKIN